MNTSYNLQFHESKFIFKHIKKIKEFTLLAYNLFQFFPGHLCFRTYQKGNNILESIQTNTRKKHINRCPIQPTHQYIENMKNNIAYLQINLKVD